MAEKEKKDAGLHKLTVAERKALDDALLRICIHLRQASQEDDEFSLYDSRGEAAAFIDPEHDITIYLWSGKPVAYLDKNSVYGFNGRHLGWFIKGAIYDHDGLVGHPSQSPFFFRELIRISNHGLNHTGDQLGAARRPVSPDVRRRHYFFRLSEDMYFYFDESGDFAIPNSPATHRAAVVMGVAVSDLIHDEFREQFHSFVASFDASECLNGEPKGSRLSYAHLMDFCEMLTAYDGISLTPVTLDLSSLSRSAEKQMMEEMYQALCASAEAMLYPQGRKSMLLIARQYRNLSINQALRIYSLANCILEALEHAIIFLGNRGHEKVWEDVRFEIDRVQVRPNSREEKVFSLMVLAWLTGWSRSRPFTLVREIHTPDHPFVRKYALSDGIDIGKLVRGRIDWVDSSESGGMQIADIGAKIVYQAAHATERACFVNPALMHGRC